MYTIQNNVAIKTASPANILGLLPPGVQRGYLQKGSRHEVVKSNDTHALVKSEVLYDFNKEGNKDVFFQILFLAGGAWYPIDSLKDEVYAEEVTKEANEKVIAEFNKDFN